VTHARMYGDDDPYRFDLRRHVVRGRPNDPVVGPRHESTMDHQAGGCTRSSVEHSRVAFGESLRRPRDVRAFAETAACRDCRVPSERAAPKAEDLSNYPRAA
jgi:hypothetical protein